MNATPPLTDHPGSRGPLRAAGLQISVSGLTKRFGTLTAVDHLEFTVEPGRVTGFLGPNGAGKTTTLRMLLGLVRPTAGTATIGGHPYQALAHPLQTVGAALEATNFHPGRSGRDHLRVLTAAGGIPDRRADELLDLVGLAEAGRKRAGGYSMGMRQRLGLAAALLGDPQVLLLDEPANGLDPEGIRWLREFLRVLAGQGKTVLVSSHMLSEVEQTVDDVVIIAQGRKVAQGPIATLRGEPTVFVRAADLPALGSALVAGGIVGEARDGGLLVRCPDPVRVGELAFRAGIPVHELRTQASDLEDLFFRLTQGQGLTPGGTPPPAPGSAPAADLPAPTGALPSAPIEGGQA